MFIDLIFKYKLKKKVMFCNRLKVEKYIEIIF